MGNIFKNEIVVVIGWLKSNWLMDRNICFYWLFKIDFMFMIKFVYIVY